jgi:hypothetical protein
MGHGKRMIRQLRAGEITQLPLSETFIATELEQAEYAPQDRPFLFPNRSYAAFPISGLMIACSEYRSERETWQGR